MLGKGRPPSSSHLKASGRHPRQSSGAAYSVFDAAQIQTFKEAFNMIDQDSDGLITRTDLEGVLVSLGQTPSPALLSSLLSSIAPAKASSSTTTPPINFTLFLTAMASHLSLMDTEVDLLESFASFDEDDRGVVSGKQLKKWLSEEGDRMDASEISALLTPPFYDPSTDLFDYRAFCQTLRVVDHDDVYGGAGEAVP
ncbi:myosin regulatory light chain 9 [Pseudohyphozyma bogoriensis]|nr:myosin regulatory light chain 9 [Pseudohyphozyma bogoriensis]